MSQNGNKRPRNRMVILIPPRGANSYFLPSSSRGGWYLQYECTQECLVTLQRARRFLRVTGGGYYTGEIKILSPEEAILHLVMKT